MCILEWSQDSIDTTSTIFYFSPSIRVPLECNAINRYWMNSTKEHRSMGLINLIEYWVCGQNDYSCQIVWEHTSNQNQSQRGNFKKNFEMGSVGLCSIRFTVIAYKSYRLHSVLTLWCISTSTVWTIGGKRGVFYKNPELRLMTAKTDGTKNIDGNGLPGTKDSLTPTALSDAQMYRTHWQFSGDDTHSYHMATHRDG